MRVLMTVSLPVETANDMAMDGMLGKKIKEILDEQKPEAAYFTTEDGMRTGLIFLNLKYSSEIPKYAEPWFLSFDAFIDVKPVMSFADLQKAEKHIKAAVKKYSV